jgi:hypothetical protein
LRNEVNQLKEANRESLNTSEELESTLRSQIASLEKSLSESIRDVPMAVADDETREQEPLQDITDIFSVKRKRNRSPSDKTRRKRGKKKKNSRGDIINIPPSVGVPILDNL